MISLDRLNNYKHYCYITARDAGWWHDPITKQIKNRNKGELLCLVHSELSEAYEADIHNVNDDKLTHRKGVEVELADAIIRILDYAGGFGYDFTKHLSYVSDSNQIWPDLHSIVSSIMESERKNLGDVSNKIVDFVSLVESFAIDCDMDLWQAVSEKVEFNKSREDHKPDNRAKANGKKF